MRAAARQTSWWWLKTVPVLLVALAASACSASSVTEVVEPAPTQNEEVSLDEALERLRLSTVRVLADFERADGEILALGGSGFFIDDEGYIVTNMHVVHGGVNVRVLVADQREPVPATIVGFHGCSDLALLKAVRPGGAFLEFYEGMATPGLPVWAAGFPFTNAVAGDVYDYTLTNGIVNTVSGSGQTYASSLDAVVEHSAKGRSGDSGGPVVDSQARVVGVTFFGSDIDDVNLAIDGGHAAEIAEQLRERSIESFGVEGQAARVANPETEGSWVEAYSVHPGSEAAEAGLIHGDRIVRLDGSAVGVGGKLTDFCEILRSRTAGQPLDIEVFRPQTGETLVGSVAGAPLQVVSLASPQVEGETSYAEIVNRSERLSVTVPEAWQVSDEPRGVAADAIYASPNLDAMNQGLAGNELTVPGLLFEVLEMPPDLDVEAMIGLSIDDQELEERCTSTYTREWAKQDGSLTGEQLIFDDCDASGATAMFLFAVTADGSTLLRLSGFSVDEASMQAVETALRTFLVSS